MTPDKLEKSRHNASDPELKEAHDYFSQIKTKIDSNQAISEQQQQHFCWFIDIIHFKDEFALSIDNYPLCIEHWFKTAFLTYWHNLHGTGKYTSNIGREITRKQALRDTSKLIEIADKWKLTVETTNHQDEILQYLTKETRSEIKNFNKLPEYNWSGFLNKNNSYTFNLRRLLLRSKMVYQKSNEISKSTNAFPFLIHVDAELVYIDSFSIVHVLSRHYAMSIKQTDKDKDMFTENIRPKAIPTLLKEVFELINQNVDITKIDLGKLYLQIDKEDFMLWTKKVLLQKKDKLDRNVLRIQSFYPLSDLREIKYKNDNLSEQTLSERVSIYVLE